MSDRSSIRNKRTIRDTRKPFQLHPIKTNDPIFVSARYRYLLETLKFDNHEVIRRSIARGKPGGQAGSPIYCVARQ